MNFLVFFIVTFLVFRTQANLAFSKFRMEMEDLVKSLTSQIQSYPLSDYKQCPQSCHQTLFNQCKGMAKYYCEDSFPDSSSCSSPGIQLSSQPAFRLPSLQNSYKQKLTCAQSAFICTPKKLKSIFQGQLNQKRKKRYTKGYVGSFTGVFLSHPGTFENCDELYDPRSRPWYISASAGPKNVLIITDLQNSTVTIKRSQQISSFIVDLFGSEDEVQSLNIGACELNGNSICQVRRKATDQWKQSIKRNIQSQIKDLFQIDMNKMSEFIRISFNENKTTQNVLLYVTNKQNEEIQQLQPLISSEQGLLAEKRIKFVPIMVGNFSSIYKQKLKSLACSTKTFFIHDENLQGNLHQKLKIYTDYLSQSLIITEPVWTDIYKDFFGFGRMVTIAMPAFINNTLVAVAGIDVTIQYIQKTFDLQQHQIVQQLIPSPINQQEVQICDYCNGSLDCFHYEELSQNLQYFITFSLGQQKPQKCCNVDLEANYIVIIVVISIISIISLIFLIIYCWKKKNKRHNLQILDDHKKQGTKKDQPKQDETNQTQDHISSSNLKIE